MKKRIWKNRIVASVMAGILFLSQHSIFVFAAGVVEQIGKETGIVQEETEISDKISVEQEEKQQEEEQKDEDLEEPIEEIQESLSVENQEKQEELEETCLEEGKVPSGSAIMLTES